MISIEDCIGMCGLSREQVLAIAEHESLPEIAAAALAQYILRHEHGCVHIRDMIVDDVRAAHARGDSDHVQTLLHVLHGFLKEHPEAAHPPPRLPM